ncbi:nucleoporin autopeptidase-domain-containing protein [Chlamydoabsidia padenii]|nr:nucleoporin autopeptidase-domain-containing protein [Chlamydoabsidia padenii]
MFANSQQQPPQQTQAPFNGSGAPNFVFGTPAPVIFQQTTSPSQTWTASPHAQPEPGFYDVQPALYSDFPRCSPEHQAPRHAFTGGKVPFGRSFHGIGTAFAHFAPVPTVDLHTGDTNHYVSITTMPQFYDLSFEELRLQDYCQNHTTREAPFTRFGPISERSFSPFGSQQPPTICNGLYNVQNTVSFATGGPLQIIQSPQVQPSSLHGKSQAIGQQGTTGFAGKDSVGNPFTLGSQQNQARQTLFNFRSTHSTNTNSPTSSTTNSHDTTEPRGFSFDTLNSGDNNRHSDDFRTLNSFNSLTLDSSNTNGDRSDSCQHTETSDAVMAFHAGYTKATSGSDLTKLANPQPTTTLEKEAQDHASPITIGVAKKEGYYCIPSLDVLKLMSPAELKNVNKFMVGRFSYGKVEFNQPVDLSGVNLDSIMANLVCFGHKHVAMYPDINTKPPPGSGLNVPATVTLYGCYTMDKTTDRPVMDPSHSRYAPFLKKLKSRPGTTFVGHDVSNGAWTFTVDSF